ncbi:MAG: hypothetical protein ACHRXM_31950 [Isosphaerales bacterium]
MRPAPNSSVETFGRAPRRGHETRAEQRFRRRMRWMQRAFAAGRIGFDAIRPRIMSWLGHARHADTYRLRTHLFRRMTFQRATTKPSSAPGWDVQQSTVERPRGEP